MNGRFHLVGIGGVGMSALAEVLAFSGAQVTGSDRSRDQGLDLPVFSRLEEAGIRLVPQDGTGIQRGLDAAVFSTAVEPDNPDWKAAKAREVPRRHRAEILAERVGTARCIAVAGTSGKTTVTGMLGWTLAEIGLDPWVVNGGAVRDWRGPGKTGHTRKGGSDLWVIEADESDRSLLHFSPEWAVLTTVSQDHFGWDETVALFQRFAGQVRRGLISTQAVRAVLGEGLPWRLADPRGFSPDLGPDHSRFRYGGLTWDIPLPGLHNAWNARLTATVCRALGCDVKKTRAALGRFRGIHRRLETVAAGPIRVMDDYAHNPEKIRAAWTAAAAAGGRVLGVWRPHGFGPLRQMQPDLELLFTELCRPPHRLFLLPVYYAGGTAQASVTSAELAGLLARRGVAIQAVRGYADVQHAIAARARPGDTVLIMGARDPELSDFAQRLAKAVNPTRSGGG